jgi:rRNA maturation protein Nop10
MKEECCGNKTSDVKPPKYSPEDKYAKYRRETKEEERKQKQLL